VSKSRHDHVLPKSQRAKIVENVLSGGALPAFGTWMGDHSYDKQVKGQTRTVRCQFFDLLKASGRWVQGDSLPRRAKTTGDTDQLQTPKRAAEDMRRARRRIAEDF
jgi:hypothetical protein